VAANSLRRATCLSKSAFCSALDTLAYSAAPPSDADAGGCTITVPVGNCSAGMGSCPIFHIRHADLYAIPCCFAHTLNFIWVY